MKNFKKYLLIAIICIAAVLRLWQIGTVPASPTWDEVSLGYNAYAILKTGCDEYGDCFPFVLKSFGDYKPALYAYLIIPFIEIIGLSLVSIRLPSILFGILSVYVLYLIVKKLFFVLDERNNIKENDAFSEPIALLSSLLLAISPWHIQFSRAAFEANVGLSFILLGLFFFLKAFKYYKYFFISIIFFIASIYTYQSEKLFLPLFFLLLLLIFRQKLLLVPKKYLIITLLIGIFLSMPMLHFTFLDKNGLARARGANFLNGPLRYPSDRTIARLEADEANNYTINKIFDNRRVEYAKIIITNYLSHFDLNWLFITGDFTYRHQPPYMGHLYLWDLPFLFIGMYQLLKRNINLRFKVFILGWIFVTPIPAAITWDVPHAIRTLHMVPPIMILLAFGMYAVYQWIRLVKTPFVALLVSFGIVLLFLFNFSYYLNQYFIQYNYFASQEWQYGFKEMVFDIKQIEKNYDKIVVSNGPPLDQSYIFFLYYLQYPPEKYQYTVKARLADYKYDVTFDKYEFRGIDWNKEKKDKRILYVIPAAFVLKAPVIKQYTFLDGKPAYKIVQGGQ